MDLLNLEMTNEKQMKKQNSNEPGPGPLTDSAAPPHPQNVAAIMTACLSACTVGHLTQPPPIHSHKRKGWKYIVMQKICKQGTKRLWRDCTFYVGGTEEGNSSIWSPASGLMAESVFSERSISVHTHVTDRK